MLPSWIARLIQAPLKPSRRCRRAARHLPKAAFRPRLEVLEDRTLLSSPSTVNPVSIAASGSTMGNGQSSTTAGTLSANGQYEVFTSSANDLVSGPTISNSSENVYRRDLVNGTTSLVSINSAGTGDVGAYFFADDPAITADGRYVAFYSNATDLTSNATGGLFVRDMTQGQTYLVNTTGNPFFVPSIGESNGRLAIAFTAYDSKSNAQVYVSTFQLDGAGDIQSGTLATKLVSADSNGNGGNSSSLYPVLSQDGSTLAFNSYATNLNVPGGYYDDTGYVDNLYLYSLTSQTLKLLSAEPTTGTNATGNDTSRITSGYLFNGPVSSQTVSSNGQYVVFTSGSDNLVAGATNFVDTSNVYWRDLTTGTTKMVSVSTSGTGVGGYASAPVITPDGRYVAFFSGPSYGAYGPGLTSNDTKGGIFVRDMTTGQIYMVRNGATMGEATNNYDGGLSMAEHSNGQLVIAYEGNDSSGSSQIYVSTLNLDPTTGDIDPTSLTTKLVSADNSGNGGNGSSSFPLLSKDGNTLAFVSTATNLNGEPEGNFYVQLFSYDLSSGILTQVSPASNSQSETWVYASSISISDHGDLAYQLAGSNFAGFYAWNAATGTNTEIPDVPYPQYQGVEYGGVNETAISGDGSTIAFHEGDVFGHGYIFAASNWQSGTPTYTQISPGVGATINGNTVYTVGTPSISDNGQVIAYTLWYSQSVPSQLFVYDNGTTTEASAAFSGGDSNGIAEAPAVSGDGSTVVFLSGANNLLPNTFDFTFVYHQVSASNIYAYNVAGSTVSLVSAKAPGLFAADNTTSNSSLSDNGRYVAFYSPANDLQGNLSAENVFAEDVQTGIPTLISVNSSGADDVGGFNRTPVISGDGSTVAFSSTETDLVPNQNLNGDFQIYSRNWLASTPTTTLISVNSTGSGGGNNGSYDPSISDNGQIIAFDSYANNLTANDPNASGYTQTFIRNLGTNTTTLASSNNSGTDGGNGNSGPPILSAAGNVVVYNSSATDLVSGVSVPTNSNGNPIVPNVYAFGTAEAENAASVSSVSVQWGTSGSAQLFTAADGVRLLPQGRNTDLPWLNIQQITITLSQPAMLSSSDVRVSGINGTDYGPVSVTELSLTSYLIKLANPISKPDRVTTTISNEDIANYTRRLDVLPGDFNDDGIVNSADLAGVYRATSQGAYNVFADINGDGLDTMADVILIRALIGNKLPPLPVD